MNAPTVFSTKVYVSVCRCVSLVYVCVSRKRKLRARSERESSAAGHKGAVDSPHFSLSHLLDPTHYMYYLCGATAGVSSEHKLVFYHPAPLSDQHCFIISHYVYLQRFSNYFCHDPQPH